MTPASARRPNSPPTAPAREAAEGPAEAAEGPAEAAGDPEATFEQPPPDAAEPRSDVLRIRRAAVGDARRIAEIGVLGWQAAYRGILPAGFLDGLATAPREAAWRSMLESGEEGAPSWVAEGEGGLQGYATSGPPRDEDVPRSAGEVYGIYVVPEAWRAGAGRALLTAAVDHWRERGARELVLWVLEANARARAFYVALGWRADGTRRVASIAGDPLPEIRYRLRL